MTPDWERVDDLFSRALELPEERRVAFLDGATGTDQALRRAVEELLALEEEAGGTIEAMAQRAVGGVWDILAAEVEQNEADLVGIRLGPFLVIRRIDRGGMGTVYLAERADGAFERQVAIKVLRRGIDTEDVVRRFLSERQILASLEHPNIARLLDGGSTADGRPYLVMDYVEGRPLIAYADEERLGVDARLQLFESIAQAVQFAHRHLVVHRDLKPSNILVDSNGRPRLLDFGIAKLLDPGSDGWSAPRTRTGVHLLTPGHASPEQLAGRPPTTATDIYQLGLVLYTLLSGRHAQSADRLAGPSDLTVPLRPSAALSSPAVELEARDAESIAAARSTSVSALRKRLAGDLDTIVLTALHIDPARRYASVEHMLEDVRRHRSGLPIEARRDSVTYRASRFAARHRLAMGAAALMVLLLAGYGATVTVQARQIAAERDRAGLEAAKARQVTELLVGIFEVSDPDGADGDTISARTLLDAAARRLDTGLADQPEVRADLRATVGRIYSRLGRYDLARPQLEQALADHREFYGGAHEQIVTDLVELASVRGVEDGSLIVPTLEEAVDVAARIFGTDHPRYAATISALAIQLPDDEAERREALRLDAVRILRNADTEDAEPYLAEALLQAAYGSSAPEAPSWMREALDIRMRLFGDSSLQVARAQSDLALAVETREPLESEALLRRSLATHRAILGDRHPETLTIMQNLAGVLRDRGENRAAEPLYREVLAGRLAENPPATSVRLAFTMHGLGWVLAELGHHHEAEPMLREVVRILESDGPALLPLAASTLGRCLALQRQYAEAERLLLAGYRDGPDYLPLLQRVVDLYVDWDRPRQAERYRGVLEERGEMRAAGS